MYCSTILKKKIIFYSILSTRLVLQFPYLSSFSVSPYLHLLYPLFRPKLLPTSTSTSHTILHCWSSTDSPSSSPLPKLHTTSHLRPISKSLYRFTLTLFNYPLHCRSFIRRLISDPSPNPFVGPLWVVGRRGWVVVVDRRVWVVVVVCSGRVWVSNWIRWWFFLIGVGLCLCLCLWFVVCARGWGSQKKKTVGKSRKRNNKEK